MKKGLQNFLGAYIENKEPQNAEEGRKPNGYWRDFDNVKIVILEIADKVGHFPSREEVCEHGYSTLSYIASKYHGGFEAIKRKMKIKKVFKKSKKMIEIEGRIWEPVEVYLKREYLDNRRSTMDIGEELKLTWASVGRWLDKFEIEKRTVSEQLLGGGVKRPSKIKLEKWYVEQRLSPNQLKERLNVSWPTVVKWLREYDIPTRDISESRMSKGGRKPIRRELERLYLDERVPMNKIAKRYGVTTGSIRNWCDDYGINRRSNSESKLPEGFKKPTKKQLERMYVRDQLSLYEIGKKFGVSEPTIRRIAIDYEIKIRKNESKYNDQSYRKGLVDRLLVVRKKKPEELSSWDFQRTRDRGVLCFAGVLQWYERENDCGPREARYIMLQELYEVSKEDIENKKLFDYWKKLENVIKEVQEIKEKHNLTILPSLGKLSKMGHSSLASAINKYHGGFNAFRKLIGEKQIKTPNGQWQDFDYTVTRVLEAMSQLGYDDLPSRKVLENNGYAGLVGAIKRYHGGYKSFRGAFNERLSRPSDNQKSDSKTSSELENFLLDYVGDNHD